MVVRMKTEISVDLLLPNGERVRFECTPHQLRELGSTVRHVANVAYEHKGCDLDFCLMKSGRLLCACKM